MKEEEIRMMKETLQVTVLYGSETGTAHDTAEEIWKSAKRFALKCSVSSMDDYDIENLSSESLVIFVAATTGQGDPPNNMKKFWRVLLKKSLPTNLLAHVKYAVLGLGDSSYEKFNFAAKKLNKRLAQLGGKEILPIGLADDQHDLGIDAVVDPWIKDLWDIVQMEFNISLERSEELENHIERYNVQIVNMKSGNLMDKKETLRDIHKQELEFNERIKLATVIENLRTTSEDHFQDVRLIKLELKNIEYEPGDLLYLRPKNSLKQIESFFELLRDSEIPLKPETTMKICQKEMKIPDCLRGLVTFREIVEQYWDLNFKPRRSTMQLLASISDDELEKSKLLEFSFPAGQNDLYNYVNRPRRNIVEVLRDFPHTSKKLNERILFEVMVPIKPRAFSIASSNKFSEGEIHLLVAVVKYKTKLFEPRLGLCSNWLASLKIGDEIICWLQKGTFQFNLKKPMILIGPGTGIAAFRSLLLDRAAQSHNLEDTILFFGCRYKEKDYHCRQELEKLTKENKLKVFCAFSRDQEEKIYVQHVIRQQGEHCWKFLMNGGQIYLSGSSKNMPKYVRDEFVDLVKKFGELSDIAAENYVRELEKTGRYQTETWG